MKRWKAPNLHLGLGIIISDSVDLTLVSEVLCHCQVSGTYYNVFTMPNANYKKNDIYDNASDDYFCNVICKRSSRLILNSLANINAHDVIMIGIDELQLSYFETKKYFNVNFVMINNYNDILEKLCFLEYKPLGDIRCKSSELAIGVYKARMQNKRVIVDEKADPLGSIHTVKSDGLIVLESKGDVIDIIISNYAFSVGASLMIINPVSKENIKEFNDDVINWKKKKNNSAFMRVDSFLSEQLNSIDISSYEYISFVTDGIPYGILYNDVIYCSHILRDLRLDIFLFNNILYENLEVGFDSALIFSPEPLDLKEGAIKEKKCILNDLRNNGVNIRILESERATIKSFEEHLEMYPYDLMHIISHGGKVEGYSVTRSFCDRNGDVHVVEYEEVVELSRETDEKCYVSSKFLFKYFDDLEWMSEALKNMGYKDYVYIDMMKALYDDPDDKNNVIIDRVKLEDYIEGSCHVSCYDGIHQGNVNFLAAQSSPIIFNNSCHSWKDFSRIILANGCRGYVGTIWEVGNDIAISASEIFYSRLYDLNIIESFNHMVQSIKNDIYSDIYIFCGVHFSTLKKSSDKSGELVKKKLVEMLFSLMRKITKEKTEEVLLNNIRHVKFIITLLTRYYNDLFIMKCIVNALKDIELIEEKMKL